MATKKIKLGVRTIDVPELAIRQRRIVVPLGVKLRPTLIRLKNENSILSLTTEELIDMQQIVYQGVSRADPKLPWEAFQDFVFDEIDLINALSVVLGQAGFEKRDDETGEANGAAVTPISPQTGSTTSTT
jgi:hypothetical protein